MVFTAKHNCFENADIQPGRYIHTKVMNGAVFIIEQFIATGDIDSLRHQLHEQVHVIELPDACIYFQKKITIAKIAQEQTAVAAANKIFIITKLEVEVFGGCEVN